MSFLVCNSKHSVPVFHSAVKLIVQKRGLMFYINMKKWDILLIFQTIFHTIRLNIWVYYLWEIYGFKFHVHLVMFAASNSSHWWY